VRQQRQGTRDKGQGKRTAFVLIVAFIAAAAPVLAGAQQSRPWEKIPIPPLREFTPQQPKRVELKNGIVLFLQEDHELPFINGSVLIPGGSRDEDAAKIGLVALYGEARAAHIETSGGLNSTGLAWDSLKGDADQVFSMAMDLLLHPKFNAEKLQLAQQQAATGIVRRNDDAGAIAGREAAKLVYGASSPFARQPELATIGAVKLADLEAWHQRTIGGKLIVAVSGDFDPSAMEAKLRAAFEPLPPVKPLPERHETFSDPKQALFFVDKEDVNQSNVQIVGLGTDRRNPDVPTLSVMNDILGGGFASRLFQKIRTEKGYAYAVGGGIGADYDHPGMFTVEVLTQSVNTVPATRLALDEIAGLTTRPFTEEELQRAKDNILNSFLFRYDTREKVLAERVRLEFYGFPPDYLEKYQAAVRRVTLADLTAAAKKYIHPDRLAVLVVGNKPEIQPWLDALQLGQVHTLDITIPGAAGMGPANGGDEKQ
jgi:zinc protease